MRTQSTRTDGRNSRLTTAIVSRSQTFAQRVSRVMQEVRASHLDDAFLATEKGMGYRCNHDPHQKRG